MIDEFDNEEINSDEEVDLDISTIDNVEKFTSQRLCDIIVCYRYLGLHKSLSILCMEELGKRRVNGDNFIFEKYIEEAMKDMPVLNLGIPDLGDILRQFGSK